MLNVAKTVSLLLPISSLEYIYQQINLVLNVGDTFTDINEVNICEKYIVPTARNSNPGGKAPKAENKFNRLVNNQFYLHGDTQTWRNIL